MFLAAAAQEKTGPSTCSKMEAMIGLNEVLLAQYVDWLTCKRMTAVGLDCGMKPGASNPLPWTQKWIAGSRCTSCSTRNRNYYLCDRWHKQDVDNNTFKGFSL
jgi:ribonucleoside-diphosphate reductase beta chain